MPILTFCRLTTPGTWHTPASTRGKQPLRPPPHCTHTTTRVCLSLTSSPRITRRLVFGMVCTPGTPGTASRARATNVPETSGAGSVRRGTHAGACVSRHTGYMGGLPQNCNTSAPGSFKRVKGRSHPVEKRPNMHPHKPHATSQPPRLSHTYRPSTHSPHSQHSH